MPVLIRNGNSQIDCEREADRDALRSIAGRIEASTCEYERTKEVVRCAALCSVEVMVFLRCDFAVLCCGKGASGARYRTRSAREEGGSRLKYEL